MESVTLLFNYLKKLTAQLQKQKDLDHAKVWAPADNNGNKIK